MTATTEERSLAVAVVACVGVCVLFLPFGVVGLVGVTALAWLHRGRYPRRTLHVLSVGTTLVVGTVLYALVVILTNRAVTTATGG